MYMFPAGHHDHGTMKLGQGGYDVTSISHVRICSIFYHVHVDWYSPNHYEKYECN